MFLSLLLLLQAAPVETAQPAPEKPREKVVCRRIAETGSLIGGKRVCMTPADWQQQERDARDSIDRFHQSSVAPGK